MEEIEDKYRQLKLKLPMQTKSKLLGVPGFSKQESPSAMISISHDADFTAFQNMDETIGDLGSEIFIACISLLDI